MVYVVNPAPALRLTQLSSSVCFDPASVLQDRWDAYARPISRLIGNHADESASDGVGPGGPFRAAPLKTRVNLRHIVTHDGKPRQAYGSGTKSAGAGGASVTYTADPMGQRAGWVRPYVPIGAILEGLWARAASVSTDRAGERNLLRSWEGPL
jgi:hypothetical protein